MTQIDTVLDAEEFLTGKWGIKPQKVWTQKQFDTFPREVVVGRAQKEEAEELAYLCQTVEKAIKERPRK